MSPITDPKQFMDLGQALARPGAASLDFMNLAKALAYLQAINAPCAHWPHNAPKQGLAVNVGAGQGISENNLSSSTESRRAHSLKDRASENQRGSSGGETGTPTPSRGNDLPAQNFRSVQ